MHRNTTRTLLASLIASLFIPLGAQAADAELMKKIEAMAKEIESLRAQVQANQEANRQAIADVREVKEKVQKNEEKSLDKWLTVGGDYQFRVDSLAGETKTFTDVNATFANAQNQLQAAFFANPSPANAAALSGLMGFAQGMALGSVSQ